MFVEEAGGEHLYHYKWKSSAPDNIFTTFKIGKPFRRGEMRANKVCRLRHHRTNTGEVEAEIQDNSSSQSGAFAHRPRGDATTWRSSWSAAGL